MKNLVVLALMIFSQAHLLADGGFAAQNTEAQGEESQEYQKLRRSVERAYGIAAFGTLTATGLGVVMGVDSGDYRLAMAGVFAMAGVQCSKLFTRRVLKKAKVQLR